MRDGKDGIISEIPATQQALRPEFLPQDMGVAVYACDPNARRQTPGSVTDLASKK